ncbi:hypothetical protein [Longimicrobium sp.]|jgi:hypothetical protein|uniref:hypothetical protein n=1 Tax=Longimicrobium sp. TaxID=2029185 RepID=UPI002ED78510
MRFLVPLMSASMFLPLMACNSPTAPPEVLMVESFNMENSGLYKLNYTGFVNWDVTSGSVDLVGTAPFDDFLPKAQGLYVDLDGTTKAAGTLRSKQRFDLKPGTYRLEFRMSGTPRPNQPPNTMRISVGSAFSETVTLQSYAPLTTFARTFRVRSTQQAHLEFAHAGGDDYGNFIDDIRFERL